MAALRPPVVPALRRPPFPRTAVAALLLLPGLLPALEQKALVVPNEHGQPPGSVLALEGGAGVARSYEAASAWYNPAAAAGLDRSSLSVSASAYELSQVRLETAAAGTSATIGANAVKGFAGSASRWPPWEDHPADDAPMSVFTVTSPRSWRAAVDQRQEVIPPGGGLRTVGSAVGVNLATYAGQWALAWTLPQGFALGAGAAGLLDNLSYSNTTYLRDVTTGPSPGPQSADQTLSVSDSEISLQGIVGASWSDGRWSAGMALRSASASLWSQGYASFSSSRIDYLAGRAQLADGRTDDASQTIHPWELTLGLGRTEPGLTWEVDATWSAPMGEVESLASIPLRTIQAEPNLPPAIALGERAPQHTTYRSVLNLAAGLGVGISPDLTLHLGVFTDRSPVASSEFYDQLDLYGASAGLSVRLSRTILHLGATAVISPFQSTQVADPESGTQVDASLRAIRVDGLIGVTHRF